jgi:hypothetical protein
MLCAIMKGGVEVRYGMGVGCVTEVMLHSSISYHQEHALPTEPRRLHNDDTADCGAVIAHFHGVSNL